MHLRYQKQITTDRELATLKVASPCPEEVYIIYIIIEFYIFTAYNYIVMPYQVKKFAVKL